MPTLTTLRLRLTICCFRSRAARILSTAEASSTRRSERISTLYAREVMGEDNARGMMSQ